MVDAEDATVEGGTNSTPSNVFYEIISSPINLALLTLCFYLLYKIFCTKKPEFTSTPSVPQLTPLKKRDMNCQQLKQYDGTNEEGRICIAVNGKIFDVTKGKAFYGSGGPYSCFAGRDASRGLAMFSVDVEPSDDYDDLSDLNSMQMEKVREWEEQFTEKYHYVGRLLKPGEEPTDYSDDEDGSQEQSVADTSSTSSTKKDK